MPGYLIYSPKRFPEVLNAVTPLGDTAVDMPTLIAVYTDMDIDDLTAIVREAAGNEDSLIVQSDNAQYKGSGRVASVGEILNRR